MKRTEIDLQRWAILGAVLSAGVILLARFAVIPALLGDGVAADLGNTVGGLFLFWLLGVAIAAVLLTWRRSRGR